jgi:outer membrane protein TolC
VAEARAAEESVAALARQAEALAERIAAQRRAYEAGYGDYSSVLDGEIARLGLEAEVATERARRMAAAARANALLMSGEETVR